MSDCTANVVAYFRVMLAKLQLNANLLRLRLTPGGRNTGARAFHLRGGILFGASTGGNWPVGYKPFLLIRVPLCDNASATDDELQSGRAKNCVVTMSNN